MNESLKDLIIFVLWLALLLGVVAGFGWVAQQLEPEYDQYGCPFKSENRTQLYKAFCASKNMTVADTGLFITSRDFACISSQGEIHRYVNTIVCDERLAE